MYEIIIKLYDLRLSISSITARVLFIVNINAFRIFQVTFNPRIVGQCLGWTIAEGPL